MKISRSTVANGIIVGTTGIEGNNGSSGNSSNSGNVARLGKLVLAFCIRYVTCMHELWITGTIAVLTCKWQVYSS